MNSTKRVEKAQQEQQEKARLKEEVMGYLLSTPKKIDEASDLLAKNFLKTHNLYTIRSDKVIEMWIYDEGIYVPNGATAVKEFVYGFVGAKYSTYFINQVTAKVQVNSYINQEKMFEEAPTNLIPVQNGILDITTATLQPFTPELRFFHKLPVTYNKKAKSPNCLKFFMDVLPNSSDRKFL